MSLPANWSTVPVSWTIVGHDGTPASGVVVFRSAQIVTADGGTYVPAPIAAQVIDGAMAVVDLPTTDDPDISPTGWLWRVQALTNPGGPRAFDIFAPVAGGPINLATAVPVGTPPPVNEVLYVPVTQKGTAGGVATLDGAALVPDAQIPATITRDSELAAHTADVSNPHAVTKAQVGLSAVSNDLQIPAALVDAKGDLLVGTAPDTVARLAVGANGALAVPDSTQTSGWKFLTTRLFEGTGFPEGVVTAPVGSRYIDTAATNGAIEWIKATGAGNTGWKVVYGSTGLRRLATASAWPFTTTGYVDILRQGELCTLTMQVSHSPALAAVSVSGALADGFRPHRIVALKADRAGTNGELMDVGIATTGTVTFSKAATPGSNIFLHSVYRTADEWPATLPGTA